MEVPHPDHERQNEPAKYTRHSKDTRHEGNAREAGRTRDARAAPTSRVNFRQNIGKLKKQGRWVQNCRCKLCAHACTKIIISRCQCLRSSSVIKHRRILFGIFWATLNSEQLFPFWGTFSIFRATLTKITSFDIFCHFKSNIEQKILL